MNLAFVGFFIAGIVFAIYASTFYRMTGKKIHAYLKNYAFAYMCLAAAFLVWAVASIQTTFLVNSVIIGNILLLTGSIFLLNILFNKKKYLKYIAVVCGVALSIEFIYVRLGYFAPIPYMESGVLVFNTQKTIQILLDLLFVFIWLPANLSVAKTITANIKIEGLSYIYSFIYSVSTIAAVLLINFRTVPMVVLSFVVLGICFIMLLYSNYVINTLIPTKK